MSTSKTKSLRSLIQTKLNTVTGSTYFRQAPDNAAKPYKTFDIDSVSFPDTARDDCYLVVDVWDIANDTKSIDDIGDLIEALFNNLYTSNTELHTTFYRESRYYVEDEDKRIKHIQLKFLVQIYKV